MMLLTLLFALGCGAILQGALPAWELFGHAKVPVLLGLAIYYALTRDRNWMLVAAVLAGILQDALGRIPMGYSSCCFCLVGLIVQRYREILFGFRAMTHLMVGALAGGGVTLLLVVLLAKDGLVEMQLGWALSKIVGAAALGALCTPVAFRLVETLDLKLGNLEEPA